MIGQSCEHVGKPCLRINIIELDGVDGCAGRPAKGRRWKSVTVKE
jgi:hypothetical protein